MAIAAAQFNVLARPGLECRLIFPQICDKFHLIKVHIFIISNIA